MFLLLLLAALVQGRFLGGWRKRMLTMLKRKRVACSGTLQCPCRKSWRVIAENTFAKFRTMCPEARHCKCPRGTRLGAAMKKDSRIRRWIRAALISGSRKNKCFRPVPGAIKKVYSRKVTKGQMRACKINARCRKLAAKSLKELKRITARTQKAMARHIARAQKSIAGLKGVAKEQKKKGLERVLKWWNKHLARMNKNPKERAMKNATRRMRRERRRKAQRKWLRGAKRSKCRCSARVALPQPVCPKGTRFSNWDIRRCKCRRVD